MNGSKARRLALALLAAVVTVVVIATMASADNVDNDLSNSANSDNNQATTGVNFPVRFSVKATGDDGCDADELTPAEISIAPAHADDAGKFSFDPAVLNVTSCDDEDEFVMNICPKEAGVYDKNPSNEADAHNLTVTVTDDDGSVYNVLVESVELTVTDPAPGEEPAEPCFGSSGGGGNEAPVLDTPALDAADDEGATLTASGAFSDPDGDPLAITATGVPADSTFTDNGDGTWDWSYPTDDNYGGTIDVTATEVGAEDLTATDSFDWSTSNVDPDISDLAVTGGTACTPTVSFGIGDPGTADTWAHAVDFNGGTPTVPTILASPLSYTGDLTRSATRSGPYPSTGTKTINVAVSDDDGGSGTESLTHEVPNELEEARFGPPVQIDGNGKGLFNSGSTIPVKIRAGACAFGSDGSYTPVTGLNLKIVPLAYLGPIVGGTTMQASSNVKANADGWMRPSENQYIYNLATPKSAATGLYTLAVQQYASKTDTTPIGTVATKVIALKR